MSRPARAAVRVLAVVSFAVLALIGGAGSASGQPYTLTWWTVDGGGATGMTGGTYTLSGTAGQPDAVVALTGGTYSLSGGFWPGSLGTGGAQADVSVSLSDSPDPVVAQQLLTYTIAVVNGGPEVASAVTVSDPLPAGVGLDTAGGTGWTCGETGGAVVCTRPSLAVGPAPAITVSVFAPLAAGTLTNTVTVDAEEADPVPGNNSDTETTTVVAAPFVSLGTRSKTDLADSGAYLAGTAVTYTILLTNTGNASQADNPGHELADTLPSTLALVSAAATSGTAAADLTGNTVAWDGGIASGGSVTITIHATIQPTVALGTTIANQATVSYDADANGTNEVTTLTDDPDTAGLNDPTSFVVVSPPADFYTVTPCRLLDTRDPTGTFGGPALAANADRIFPFFGRCGIPTTARALSVNLTVTAPTTQGNLRLYPAGTPLPLVSAINYVTGLTRANNAIAPLNALGELAVRCTQASGTAHFILDVNGYFE